VLADKRMMPETGAELGTVSINSSEKGKNYN
jgi:hypothetical protein